MVNQFFSQKIFILVLFILHLLIYDSSATELKNHIIKGKIVSAQNKQPIKDAFINILGTSRLAKTNNHGYFTIIDEFPAYDSITNVFFTEIALSHISFKEKQIMIGTSLDIPNDTTFTFYLKRENILLRTNSLQAKNSFSYEKRGIIQNTTPAPPKNRKYNDQHGHIVIESPEYPGGIRRLLSFIEEMEIEVSKKKAIEGKALICFTVNEFGNVANIHSIESDNTNVENEAIKIIESTKKWKPGIQRGIAVPVDYTIPLEFK